MLQAWLSIGYIVLLAIFVLGFFLWRRGSPILAITALVVGIPLWFGWEYSPSDLDNRRHYRNGSATQRSRRAREYDRHRIYLHAQPVRQGTRADQ